MGEVHGRYARRGQPRDERSRSRSVSTLSPDLFASVPFKDLTAFRDAAGTLYLYHRAIQQQTFAVTGKTYGVRPIGDGRGEDDWLQAVQQTHNAAAQALGLAAPTDLTSYDLAQEADHTAWWFALSNDLKRFRVASGLS